MVPVPKSIPKYWLFGGFNPVESNWIISPGRFENKKTIETTTYSWWIWKEKNKQQRYTNNALESWLIGGLGSRGTFK